MMNLIDEIREDFATKVHGYMILEALGPDYPAYVMRVDGNYGVAIPYSNSLAVAERFSNAQLHTRKRILDGIPEQVYLELTSTDDNLRNEFATLCAQFVSPGQNGVERKALVNDPLTWWKNWRMLLGNSISEKQAYSVIAEMTALFELYKNNPSVCWAAADHRGTQDIEDSLNSYEVKSTLKKNEVHITISSLQQLTRNSQKKLFLYFCRMEESLQGVSINDMAAKLIGIGYDKNLLEKELLNIGYEYGCSTRDEKYRITDRRKYEVNSSFPAITEASFQSGKKPEYLLEFTYTLDLTAYPYSEW